MKEEQSISLRSDHFSPTRVAVSHFHWLPSPPQPDAGYALHKLILGTHKSDDSPNILMVANVEIIQKIYVDGKVNRARCMTLNPSVVAGKANGCYVYVFDCSKHTMKEQRESCEPDLRLRGNDKGGYGLSWSKLKRVTFFSGSNDSKICLRDVSAMPQDKVLDATHVFEAHEIVVEDVAWHLKNENLFGSVGGDDCCLMVWDLRTNKFQHSVQAHEKEVNYLSFNPYNEWVLATPSSDTTIGLFDIRKLISPLHVLNSHTEEVLQVE